jgi:ubiquinone/menaquinone biosynthesis C-methylase UbiE
MQELNSRAREYGDWLKAVDEIVPTYRSAIVPYSRADVQFMLPINKDSIVLDIGAMWGALTIPIAQYCKEVYAVDKTSETLEFLRIRAGQLGFNNIHTRVCDVNNRLPFLDSSFDVAILNGVLEWVPVVEDINLETYWKGKIQCTTRYNKSPQKMQLEVLKEVRRVLKPSGTLCLAMENRFGYQYFAGYPDDHVNIKYVSLLPRAFANIVTRRIRGCDYRTLTYSLFGYRSLLNQSGFENVQFYGTFPHYINPSKIVPVDLIGRWKDKVLPNRRVARVFPSPLLKYVSPSYIAVTGNGKSRLSKILEDIGLQCSEVVKCKSRTGNFNTANFIVYKDNKPTYFCKVGRDSKHTDILKDEARNLKLVNDMLRKTDIEHTIPKLLFHGVVGGVTILVTEYLEGEPSKFDTTGGPTEKNLLRLDREIRLSIDWLVKFRRFTVGTHGDFDFYTNVLFDGDKLRVVDFESFSHGGSPLYDLATLIYHPMLISYKHSSSNVSLSAYIDLFTPYIQKWAVLYSQLTSTPMTTVQNLARVAVEEHRTRKCPYYRNPNSFLMNDQPVQVELINRRDIHA